jgi:hypothetical protein
MNEMRKLITLTEEGYKNQDIFSVIDRDIKEKIAKGEIKILFFT